MNDFETRICHHCGRSSWVVAQGKPCPHCQRKTGKYHGIIHGIVFFGSVIGILAAAYVAYRIGGWS